MQSLSREIAKHIALVTFAALVFVCSAPAQDMARVRGVLADQQGARVNGASVSLENETFKRTIQSDQGGRFEFDVPPGKYKLSVPSHGFDEFAKDVVLNSGANEELAITLFPTPMRGSHAILAEPEDARVRGEIATQSGALIPGAAVRFESQAFNVTIQSDQAGRFELDVPVGKYKLSVACLGFKYFAQDVVLNSGSNAEIVIELEFAPGLPRMPHPAIAEPEVTIEAIHAPVFQKMAPMKLR
ncbi:MAG: carboxypeptidase-like regulatory domain-containing protein [Acidobacteriota bacterium]